MTKLEKVINGLECCIKRDPEDDLRCDACPYPAGSACANRLKIDARELLKEREPRVLTEEDFIDNPLVDENGDVPAWCEHKVSNGIAHSADGWTTISQRLVCAFSRLRFWSARPTNKQMDATPWDEPPKEGDGE